MGCGSAGISTTSGGLKSVWAGARWNYRTRCNRRPAPADVFQVDLNYLRYVWGDSQWRPFWSLGVGLATFHFIDSMGMDYNETLVAIPLGLGLKYLHRPWMAFRLDLRDNVTIAGGGLDTMQNFTFTLGAEIRLGARPRSYWPWHPSREVW